MVFDHRLFHDQETEYSALVVKIGRSNVFTFALALTDTAAFRRCLLKSAGSRLCSMDDVSYAYELRVQKDPESNRLYDQHVGKTDDSASTRATWDSTVRKALWASVKLPAWRDVPLA